MDPNKTGELFASYCHQHENDQRIETMTTKSEILRKFSISRDQSTNKKIGPDFQSINSCTCRESKM